MCRDQARYIYQRADWPNFRWDVDAVAERLAAIHFRRGQLLLAMDAVGFDLRQETVLRVLVQDVTNSSAIEGERLDADQVRSSIARRLGIEQAGLPKPERYVEGVVEMMLDATQRYEAHLDEERIFGWHAALFPTGRSGMTKIVVGAWRDDREGPMEVVSGAIGRQTVHFEAPEACRLQFEMPRFLRWFSEGRMDPVLKAAVAHLWFETLHPMDDGNGRIGRAIMDMALARADRTSRRFYSMSAQIHRDKDAYYAILERTQKASMDVTAWVEWFLVELGAALSSAEGILAVVRRKQAFWDAHSDKDLNDRQIKILNLLLDGVFVGKLHNAKYAKIAKCSAPTALRDLSELVAGGILMTEGAGRSTRYRLAHYP